MRQATRSAIVPRLRRLLPVHARICALGVALLLAANLTTSGRWWSFWPVLGWAAALFGHYLVVKAFSVDDSWAARRAADVTGKAYDAGHIDSIRDAYEHPDPPGRRGPKSPPGA